MILIILIIYLTTLALIGMALITITNALIWPRLGNSSRMSGMMEQPFVSVLIPARNEAAVIEQTLRSLLTQTYLNFEVVLLDDHSGDGTADLAWAVAGASPRFRCITGAPLPAGWSGKNWACQQLADAARGEWLIFTDADVQWAPHTLSTLMADIIDTEADLFTVWPSQNTASWGERLVVPLMALVVIGYLPLPLVHYTPWSTFAAANGQCLAFRRRAYETLGGHASVRAEILEDVILARRVKAAGLRLRMADGNGLVNCRMYRSWPGVRDGFAKNILAGYGGRVSFLLLTTVFHWFVFFLPWVWLGLGWLKPDLAGWPVWPLTLIGLGLGVRALTAKVTGQRLGDALLMPVSVLLMSRIALQSIWWLWRYGGPRWKGRTLAHSKAAG